MNDPVLRYFFRILHSRGFHIVLYNSRGVGRSSGWPSFTGLQEGKDLEELVQWGISYVGDVRHVLIVGYSYGALIASQNPVLPPPMKTSHILLSYPLDKRSLLTLFHGQTYATALKSLVQSPSSKVLLAHGTHDEFTGIKSYEVWAAQVQREATDGAEGGEHRVQVEVIEGATHFWDESCAQVLCDAVERWLDVM